MAFVSGSSPDQGANSDQDKEKNPLAEQAPMTSAPAGGGSGNPSGQASSKGPSQPFTNLSAYLGANGPQVQQMGNDIAGKLTSDYNATSGAIDTAKTSFGNAVNSGYTPMDQTVIDSFKTNPSAIAADPTKSQQFKGMYNNRYTGPGNFQDAPEYADLSGKVQKSTAFANQVETIPGLQSYLSSMSPTYTQGQATLDSALLKTNPNAVNTISTAAQPFKNLPGYLDQTVASGNQAAQTAAQQADQSRTAAQGAANDFGTNFAKTNNEQYTGMASQAQDYNTRMNAITEKINSGNYAALTAEEQAMIGYNPAATKYINTPSAFGDGKASPEHPIDFKSYFSQGDQARMPTGADVFSPDELANYNALKSLTGQAPGMNFDLPTAGTEGSFSMPGKLPQYNNMQALSAVQQANQPMYKGLTDTNFSGVSQDEAIRIKEYMNGLNSVMGGAQPAPQPTTPMPTDGGLGSGYHWDEGSGKWIVNVPLQPTGTQSGQGGVFYGKSAV